MPEPRADAEVDIVAVERAVSAYLTRILRWVLPLAVAVAVAALVAATTPAIEEDQVATDAPGSVAVGGDTAGGPSGLAGAAGASAGQASSAGASGPAQAGPGAAGAGVAVGQGVSKAGVDCAAPDARQVPWSKYSPPCVGAFSGENGGDTSHGVTAETIKIVVGFGNASENAAVQSLAGPATPNDQTWADTIKAYAAYFNTQFETYGREVVVETYQMKSDYVLADMGRDTAAAQADAQTSHDLGAFIDLTALTNTSSLPYGNALADLGVIAWSFPLRTAENYASHAPYMYNFLPDGTKWARWATNLVCHRMAGLPAIYAGGDVKDKPRKFGVIGVNIPEWKAAADMTSAQIRDECGESTVNLTYEFDLGTFSQYGASMMAQMRSEGVTTILCVCDPLGPIFMTQSATDDGYFPEWLFHNQGIVDSNYDPEQLANSFSNGPALPAPTDTEAFRVFRQAYPGEDPPDKPYFGWIYGIMMQVFSAVQMAGPNLNPQTFHDAMKHLPRSQDGGDYGPWWGDADPRYGGTFTPWTGVQVTRWSFDAPSPDGSASGYWAPCPGTGFFPFADLGPWGPARTQLPC
jgi:hypothetical protein